MAPRCIDWLTIEQDYRRTGLSYRELAEKYNVSLSSLKKIAAKGKWGSFKGTEPEPEPQEEPEPAQITVYSRETKAQRFERLVDEMANRIEDALEQVDVTNPAAIKMLTGALKDLRDMQGLNKTQLDIEEQQARIAKLRSETRVTEIDGAGGVLILPAIGDKLIPPEAAEHD